MRTYIRMFSETIADVIEKLMEYRLFAGLFMVVFAITMMITTILSAPLGWAERRGWINISESVEPKLDTFLLATSSAIMAMLVIWLATQVQR